MALPLFAFFFLLSFVRGRFVVEKSSITVFSPHKLRTKRDGAIANFGLPDSGGYIFGSVVYPDKGTHGCQAFDGDKPFKFRSNRPTILLLDRGDCYFALKVWHAQQAGAAAVLVIDDIEESLITMDFPEESNDADGYIEKMVIPSALIEKSFGDLLKDALNNKEKVLLRIDGIFSVYDVSRGSKVEINSYSTAAGVQWFWVARQSLGGLGERETVREGVGVPEKEWGRLFNSYRL